MYHYAGNNPVKYTDPDGRDDEVVIKSYIPQIPKRHVETVSGSFIPSANYIQNSVNQNKEQKACWGEATFVDGAGENSCYLQAGLYSISSELNNSPKNHGVIGQMQLDVLNADFDCSVTDGGGGVSFGVNGISLSGKIGYQVSTKNRNISFSLGGSAGAQFGGALKLDFKKGIFVFDVAVIFGGRIEANWGRRDEK